MPVHPGVVLITAFISPFNAQPDICKSLLEPRGFIGVFVDKPFPVAGGRHPKEL